MSTNEAPMMDQETRTWNTERSGYDVEGPCFNCHQMTRYFIDEDGTPRDTEGIAHERSAGAAPLDVALGHVLYDLGVDDLPLDQALELAGRIIDRLPMVARLIEFLDIVADTSNDPHLVRLAEKLASEGTDR